MKIDDLKESIRLDTVEISALAKNIAETEKRLAYLHRRAIELPQELAVKKCKLVEVEKESKRQALREQITKLQKELRYG